MAEVQRGAGAHPQTQQHTEVVHQQHRGPPLLPTVRLASPNARTGRTGPDELVETLQADGRIPGEEEDEDTEGDGRSNWHIWSGKLLGLVTNTLK